MNTKAQSVADLTALLEAAKKDERMADEVRRKERSATRKAFLATHPYIYTVSELEPYAHSTFCSSGDIEPLDVKRISRRIDADKHAAFFRNRPVDDHTIFSHEDLDKIEGIKYFLTTDGIIHHTGGGTVILKTPQLCSHEDWVMIKLNAIPVKFLRTGE